VVLALGIPISLSLHLVAENPPTYLERCKKWLPYTSIIPLIAYYVWMDLQPIDSNIIRYFQWFLYCHLLVAIAPFLKTKSDTQFWNFNYQIFTTFLITRFFGLFLFAGLSLALVSTKRLFEINVDDDAYAYLFVICMLPIASVHFLALLPTKMENLESVHSPKLLKIFCQYVLVPLNAAYVVILYSYMLKILITGVWPSGVISWLVIGISILGVFALLMMHAFTQQVENQWMKKFQNLYYASIIPLLILGLIAVSQRVNQYAVTESRYILIALNLWLLGIAIYFLVSRRKKIMVIPVSLFVLAFITSFGPWGLYQTSVRSQANRLLHLLQTNMLLKDGKVAPSTAPLDKKEVKEIRSIMTYIIAEHGVNSLPSAFEDANGKSQLSHITRLKSYQVQGEVDTYLTGNFSIPAAALVEERMETGTIFNYRNEQNGGPLGKDLMILQVSMQRFVYTSASSKKSYTTQIDRNTLVLTLKVNNEVVLDWPLETLFATQKTKENNAAVIWEYKNDRVEAYLIPNYIYTIKDKEQYSNADFTGQLVIRFLK
jgi:hypothetical protein